MRGVEGRAESTDETKDLQADEKGRALNGW